MSDTDKAAIWNELLRVTRWWSTEANQDDLAHKAVLHAAALAYADAVRASGRDVRPTPTQVSDHRTDGVLLPFGRSKGKRVADVETKDLRWYESVVAESVDNPKKERFRAQNVALLDAIRAELEDR